MHAMKKTINHKISVEKESFSVEFWTCFRQFHDHFSRHVKALPDSAKKRGKMSHLGTLMAKNLQCHSIPRPIEKGFNPCVL